MDITHIANWKTFGSTFSTPLGLAGGLIAITSLVGLYHRSLQFSFQLEILQKKENFTLYTEHKKVVREHIENAIELSKEHLYQESACKINYSVLYRTLYPKKSPTEIVNLDDVFSGIKLEIDSKSIIQKLEYLNDRDAKPLTFSYVQGILKEYRKVGVEFKCDQYDGSPIEKGTPGLIQWFSDLILINRAFGAIGVISNEDHKKINALGVDLRVKHK